ncbi:unnamed protein product [Trichobilharzia regenti]|nr:unnamed protein product [Trichobilharzia regenti]
MLSCAFDNDEPIPISSRMYRETLPPFRLTIMFAMMQIYSFMSEVRSTSTKNHVLVSAITSDLNISSRLKCLKSVGLQSPKSLTGQPTNALAKLNSYQRISCNTLMVADQEDSTQDTPANPIKLISNIAHGSSLPHLPVITQNDLITDNDLSTTSMSTAIPCYNFNHPNGFRTVSSYRRRRFNSKYQKKSDFSHRFFLLPYSRSLISVFRCSFLFLFFTTLITSLDF